MTETDHPEASSCEIPQGPEQRDARRLRRFARSAFAWDGVQPQVYKLGGGAAPGTAWRDVVRHTLVGGLGEPVSFQLRYFEIASGGYSSLEKHAHVHAIIVLRGRGRIIAGRELFTVAPFDLVYIPSGTPHQFVTEGTEPFGFLCPVDADRDAPQALTENELADLLSDPRVREAVRVEAAPVLQSPLP